MKRLLLIAPHLSTGGLPQYLVKKVELLRDEYDIYVVEYSDVTGGRLVVQRNRLISLLKNPLITLGEDKSELLNVIRQLNPHVVHMEEIPEMFCDNHIANEIYGLSRTYSIYETSHDSSFDIHYKRYIADKMILVSEYQRKLYEPLNIPIEVIDYPIEFSKENRKDEYMRELGLDTTKKHILNVGLFTPRKNQKEFFEYARRMPEYQFHSVGNMADNFKLYWEPLLKDVPPNLKIWDERSDVHKFFEAMDLFLFTSRGSNSDKETMPLVLKEAVASKIPICLYNLEVYDGFFNQFNNIHYLNFDDVFVNDRIIRNVISTEYKELDFLSFNLEKIENNFSDYFDVTFEGDENKISIFYKKKDKNYFKISVRDGESLAPIYWFDVNFENYLLYWCIPTPIHAFSFKNEKSFGNILLEFYDKFDKLQFSHNIHIKQSDGSRNLKLNLQHPYDCLFNNYNEMFVEDKYQCYGLDNLDVVFDIGANSGLFSLMSVVKWGAKKVYAFEPNPNAVINLKSICNEYDNIYVIDKAVSDVDGYLDFYSSELNTTIGSFDKSHLISEINESNIKQTTVPSVNLLTFIQNNSISNISLIKMDIEGAEYNIIDNLDESVFKITDKFLIEYHNNDDAKVLNLIQKLKSKGFNVTQIRNQNSKNNDEISLSYESSKIGTILAEKQNPILTVLVPTYNQQNYVNECINSVLSQKTTFNYNIFISDDCSTDGTFDILKEYASAYINITLHQTNSNMGAENPSRMLSLIEMIDTPYIAILDGDDYYIDNYLLQKHVDFLQKNDKYVISANQYLITSNEAVHYNIHTDTDIIMKSLKTEVKLSDNIEENFIAHGWVFKKSVLPKKLPNWLYDDNIFDSYWSLINLLLESGNGYNHEFLGSRYRLHNSSAFSTKDSSYKDNKVNIQSEIMRDVYLKKNDKPILIVDAFFHHSKSLDIFKEYLSFIKKLDIPIMLVTNSEFDTSLIGEVDYIIYDSNNRLFNEEYQNIIPIYFWYRGDKYYMSMATMGYQRHGLSVLSNLYHSTNFAKTLGYTHFFRIEYDCFIEDIESVKSVINLVNSSKKKGLVYVSDGKYISYQIFYFDLEYFTKYFPKINNETDYNDYKNKYYDVDTFVSAEEFVFNMIKHSDGGFDNLLVKEPHLMWEDYGNCKWNTLTSPVESDRMTDGFFTSVFRLVTNCDNSRPELCPIDNTKVAVIAWNSSTDLENTIDVIITRPDGNSENISYTVLGLNDHRIHIIDTDDLDINVDIIVNKTTKKYFTFNKNNCNLLKDTLQFY